MFVLIQYNFVLLHNLVWEKPARDQFGNIIIALTGFLLGLSSSVLLKAAGFLPIAPPMGWRRMNEIMGEIHIYEFYVLGVLVAVHAAFHIWRHLRLRDNALRIMFPRALHRWL